MKAPFPIIPHLTAIAIGLRNQAFIADSVLPRVPVSSTEFKWLEYGKAEAFTVPSTTVGRTSAPNQIEYSATEHTASVIDYGLDAPVPQADIENAPPNYDPLGHAVEMTTDLILLDREIRTSKLIFNKSNYKSTLVKTLTGSNKWSDPESDPLVTIISLLDEPIMRPNIAVLGRKTATALRMHPKIVKAYHGNAGDSGLVPLGFLADLLELEEILVGSAHLNSAKPGQTPVMARAWGEHAAFIYRNKLANTRGGVTFGMTAQFGSRIAGSIEDKDMGLRGGQRVRVGESVKEIIIAKDVGVFFENAA